MPQHRLRPVEGADRRRPSAPTPCRTAPAVRHDGRDRPTVDFAKVNEHVHGVIAAIAPNNSKERFTGLGVRVIEASARFSDRDDRRWPATGIEIKARRFVIATGSSPARAADPRPRAGAVPHQRDGVRSRERPEHLIVHRRRPDRARARPGVPPARLRGHGAGSSGSRSRSEDPECADDRARRARARRRRRSAAGVKIERVRASGREAERRASRRRWRATPSQGSHLLVATGRRPTSRRSVSSRPASACDAPRHRGRQAAQDQQPARLCHRRRRRPCRQFTHLANHQAGLVIRNALFRLPVNDERRRRPARDLHRSGACPCRPDRGAGARARTAPSACCAGPITRTTAPRPSAKPAAISRWSPTGKGLILGATIVGAGGRRADHHLDAGDQPRLNIRAFAEIVVPYPTLRRSENAPP